MGMVRGPDSKRIKADDGLGHGIHGHGIRPSQNNAKWPRGSAGRARTFHGNDPVPTQTAKMMAQMMASTERVKLPIMRRRT